VRGGFFTCLSPCLRHDRSRTRAEVGHVRLDELKLNNRADQRPRNGWSMPRIVETSDILYFILFPKKNTYRSQKISGYLYLLDGIVTANGEVGISGLRSTPHISPVRR
jgi:hypothetical protein